MNFTFPKIYPITDVRLSGLSHAEQVKRLASAGASLIQLREKHAPARDFFEDARSALDIARGQGTKLLINDRVDIAVALGADGVHLGQEDLPPDAARRLLGDGAIIGYSTHTIEQVRAAMLLPVDYIAFGPIFPTVTKVNPDEVVGLRRLAEVRAAIPETPLIAIGGISADNIRGVLSSGADSAAVIGAVISGDIAANFSLLQNTVKNL